VIYKGKFENNLFFGFISTRKHTKISSKIDSSYDPQQI
jgi:hypothetical protein